MDKIEFTFKALVLYFLFWIAISLMDISTDVRKFVKHQQSESEYKALYLKCNGIISTANEQGKFDGEGKLK